MNTTQTAIRFAAFAAIASQVALADLPYDADVSAIETDATQSFDTGVLAQTDIKIELDLTWMEFNNDDHMLFGASDGTHRLFLSIYNGHYYIGYGSGNLAIQNGTLCPSVGVRHTISCVFENGRQSFSMNGAELMTTSQGAVAVNNTLALLAYNRPSDILYKSAVRLYSATISKKVNGEWEVVRDYRPVMKKGTDNAVRGALYDAVGGGVHLSSSAAARAVMESVPSEPDELLAWVETDGRQFVDTEVSGGAALSFSADFAWKNVGTGSSEEYTFLGATGPYGRFYAIHAVSKSAGGQLWVGYGNASGYPVDSGSAYLVMPPLARMTVSGEFAGGSQTLSCEGMTYSVSSPNASVVNSRFAPLYLFAVDQDSAADGSRAKLFSSVRFHSLSIGLGGTDVRRFVPCLKDGEAALYDSVNHRIYRSPIPFSAYGKIGDKAKAYVEYVETSRAQFVDTGVIGRSGTKCEFDFAWLNNADETTMLGVHNASSGTAVRFEPFCGEYGSGGMKKVVYIYGTYYYPQFWSGSSSGERDKHAYLKINDRHKLVVELSSGSQHISVDGDCYYYPDGQSTAQNLDGTALRGIDAWNHEVADIVNADASMYLFARHFITATADKPTNKSAVRLYSAKIWQADGGQWRLVRNYRPVRVSTGEIVLWDKVNNNYQSACWSAVGPETRTIDEETVLFVR